MKTKHIDLKNKNHSSRYTHRFYRQRQALLPSLLAVLVVLHLCITVPHFALQQLGSPIDVVVFLLVSVSVSVLVLYFRKMSALVWHGKSNEELE